MTPSVVAVFICLLLKFSFGTASTLTPTSHAIKLTDKLLQRYDKKMKPTVFVETPINVTYSLDLYQILELNEPQQYVLLNAWVIEKWYDEVLFWDPSLYSNVSELRLPHEVIWMPDTTLYNSILMKDEEIRRLLNVHMTADVQRRATLIEMLYPAVYKFSCLLKLHYFPYDIQVCTMTVSSWTHDMASINYFYNGDVISTRNFLENEEWELLKTTVRREEILYACCPNKYAILRLTLYLRRKPLFYLVNLIIPTSIITVISIFGFFTSSSASELREEKVSLGLTTLLSMSILLLMVSDQMPTTSTFIPLMGWYILCMMILTAIAVLATSLIIAIQKTGRHSQRLSPRQVRFADYISRLVRMERPPHLTRGTEEYDNAPPCRLHRTGKFAAQTAYHYGTLAVIPNGKTEPVKTTTIIENKIDDEQPTKDTVETDSNGSTKRNRLLVPPALASCQRKIAEHIPMIMKRRRSTTARFSSFSECAMENSVDLARQVLEFNDQAKANQRLAKIEYEWLASVVERGCFVGFLGLFVLMNVVINFIGLTYWTTSPESLR